MDGTVWGDVANVLVYPEVEWPSNSLYHLFVPTRT